MSAQLLTNVRIPCCVVAEESSNSTPDLNQQTAAGSQIITAGAIAIENGRILWCGTTEATPPEYRNFPTQDLQQRLVTPSLIDCHTHIVHGGHRAAEFEQRLNGASYAEVAAAGGGIVSTVTSTRTASVDELVQLALPRVDALLAEGVSVIEIKSGYGLNHQTELDMLRAARQIGQLRPVQVVTSFLGAHAVPAEYSGRADDYIDEVCIPALVAAHKEGLVDAVDGFCESIAFNTVQMERVFIQAAALGLPVKLHAEQLTLSGGAELCARYQGLSADHLEYLDEAGVQAMADANMVAVLLPGAFYTLRESQLPPLEHFRRHQVPIAIATDSNPGSSPLTSLLLAMNMAATLFRMTPAEALLGVTVHAARALGITDCGQIAAGQRADLAVWNVQHPAELSYRIGFNPLHQRIHSDQTISKPPV